MVKHKRKGRSAAFMRSINPHLNHAHKRGHKKMARRKGKRTTSKTSKFSFWASIVGVGLFIAYEAFVSPMLPLGEPVKSIVELGIGLMFVRKKGMIGDVARAAVYINAYQLLSLYVAPMFNSVFAR